MSGGDTHSSAAAAAAEVENMRSPVADSAPAVAAAAVGHLFPGGHWERESLLQRGHEYSQVGMSGRSLDIQPWSQQRCL